MVLERFLYFFKLQRISQIIIAVSKLLTIMLFVNFS